MRLHSLDPGQAGPSEIRRVASVRFGLRHAAMPRSRGNAVNGQCRAGTITRMPGCSRATVVLACGHRRARHADVATQGFRVTISPSGRGIDMSADDPAPAYFVREHRRLDEPFRAHLLGTAGGDLGGAQQHLHRWRQALTRHIDIEETRLLPHVPGDARWAPRVYRLEHERITRLADAYMSKLDAAAAHPTRDERSRREIVLALLDAVHALQHLLEHHHQREEMALAKELPPELQEAAWQRDGDQG